MASFVLLLIARTARIACTDRHTYIHTYTHTRDNYCNPLCDSRRGLINTRDGKLSFYRKVHARCPSKTSGQRVSVSVSDRGKTMTTRDVLTSIYKNGKALILLNNRLKTTSRLPTTRKTSKIRHSYSRY